ncbi:hypothetical protein V6N13_137437 [Hibiscus sabdariffa]
MRFKNDKDCTMRFENDKDYAKQSRSGATHIQTFKSRPRQCISQSSNKGQENEAMNINKIQHVLRAGKLVADMLAKEAVHTHFETHIVEYPDGLLKVLLWSDLNANVE